MVKLNNKIIDVVLPLSLAEFAKVHNLKAGLAIINGYPAGESWDQIQISDNDEIFLLDKSQIPCFQELESLMIARHSPKVYEKLKNSCVGIAGLGGLGSNVAIMLARSGVGKLIIADYDIVEPTNLNRQQYFIDQLGQFKTDATFNNLQRINPYISIEKANVKLTAANVCEIFHGADVIVECFDLADQKQMIVEAVLSKMPKTVIISASGVAGIGASNTIKTKIVFNRHIIVGDFSSAAQSGRGLMAPRVTIAAAHEANAVIQYLVSGKIDSESIDKLI